MLKVVEKKIDERLKYLKDLELENGDKPMCDLSRRSFLKFMEFRRNLAAPSIGLYANGNICAEWIDKIAVLLEFEGKNKINFAVLFPGKRINIEGILLMGKVKKIFDVLKVWNYILV